MLTDAFGRPVTDLRISVTERCNFRCIYCHNEGQGGPVKPPNSSHADEMTPEEIQRVVQVAAEAGVTRAKLTGGEPLVRTDLEDIIARISPLVEVSLTTNGSLLAERAQALASAGLRRVNVSIDSLTPKEFEDIRGGQLAPVLRGVDAALAAGLRPLKLNLVVYQHTVKNIDPLIDFAAAHQDVRLQLIQFMPEMAWMKPHAVDMATVRSILEGKADAIAERRLHKRKRYLIRGAWVEIVDPVENPDFCAHCHRLRVTHDGMLKGCLNSNDGLIPTRGLSLEQLRAAFARAVERRVPFYTTAVGAIAR